MIKARTLCAECGGINYHEFTCPQVDQDPTKIWECIRAPVGNAESVPEMPSEPAPARLRGTRIQRALGAIRRLVRL